MPRLRAEAFSSLVRYFFPFSASIPHRYYRFQIFFFELKKKGKKKKTEKRKSVSATIITMVIIVFWKTSTIILVN